MLHTHSLDFQYNVLAASVLSHFVELETVEKVSGKNFLFSYLPSHSLMLQPCSLRLRFPRCEMKAVVSLSGLSRDATQLCRNWMAPLAEVAGLFGVPKRREFSRVNAQDEHNIQTHADYLTMLVSIFFLLACLLFQSSNQRFPPSGRRKTVFDCETIPKFYLSVILTSV